MTAAILYARRLIGSILAVMFAMIVIKEFAGSASGEFPI